MKTMKKKFKKMVSLLIMISTLLVVESSFSNNIITVNAEDISLEQSHLYALSQSASASASIGNWGSGPVSNSGSNARVIYGPYDNYYQTFRLNTSYKFSCKCNCNAQTSFSASATITVIDIDGNTYSNSVSYSIPNHGECYTTWRCSGWDPGHNQSKYCDVNVPAAVAIKSISVSTYTYSADNQHGSDSDASSANSTISASVSALNKLDIAYLDIDDNNNTALQTYKGVVKTTKLVSKPKYKGYIFLGYTHTGEGSYDADTSVFTFPSTILARGLLTASWKPIEYDIYYDKGLTDDRLTQNIIEATRNNNLQVINIKGKPYTHAVYDATVKIASLGNTGMYETRQADHYKLEMTDKSVLHGRSYDVKFAMNIPNGASAIIKESYTIPTYEIEGYLASAGRWKISGADSDIRVGSGTTVYHQHKDYNNTVRDASYVSSVSGGCFMNEVPHTHTDACYEDVTETHTHTDDCYATEYHVHKDKNGIRQSADYHASEAGGCYNTPVYKQHVHSGGCYKLVTVHEHTDICYNWHWCTGYVQGEEQCAACKAHGAPIRGALICNTVAGVHTHTDDCYNWHWCTGYVQGEEQCAACKAHGAPIRGALICKTTTKYVLNCVKTAGTRYATDGVDYYILDCGKIGYVAAIVDGSVTDNADEADVEGKILVCTIEPKTTTKTLICDDTVDGYVLSCGKTTNTVEMYGADILTPAFGSTIHAPNYTQYER